jgi:hypothetical protein
MDGLRKRGRRAERRFWTGIPSSGRAAAAEAVSAIENRNRQM